MQDMNAPQLTQDDLQAIQQAQTMAQQQPDIPQQPEVGMQQPQQPAQPVVEPNAQPTPEDIELAKKMLGLDQIEQQAREAQEKLKQIEMERTKAQVLSKYPNVPDDLVEQEIKKVEETNPQLAEAMRVNPDLYEMAVKAVLASVKPQEKPDNITQGAGTNDVSQEDEITAKVKKGEADPITLGDYILQISQQQ